MKEMKKEGRNTFNFMVQDDDTLLPKLSNPKSNHNHPQINLCKTQT
jgi:hypothetical protein